MTVERAIAACL